MSTTNPLTHGLEMYQYRLEATADTNALCRATATLGQFCEAYELEFTADALEAQIVDAAHVLAGGVSVPLEYETDHEAVTIAVEHDAFDRGLIGLDDPDTQTLTLRDGEDELTVTAASYMDHVPLADPSSLREMDAPDELEYATTVTAPARKFKAAVGAVSGPSSQPVRLSTCDDWLDVATRVDGDWYTVDLDGTATVDGPDATAYYSSDYLSDIARALSPAAEVTLRFGENYPLRVETEHMWFVLPPNLSEADSQ